MAKQLVLIILLFIMAILPSAPVNAHVLAADGDIGAVLHINPDDSPVSGSPTNYILSFSDTTNKFKLSECDCRVSVLENGKSLSSKSLAATSDLTSSNTFTFPKSDVYTLEITGKPKPHYGFQSFKIDYTVRVNAGDVQTQPMPPLLWVGMGGTIGLIILAAYTMEISYNSNDNKRKLDN